MATEIPTVRDCSALDCIYNKTWKCMATVISVGKTGSPCCDTYQTSEAVARDAGPGSGVESCGVYHCLRNRELKCIAYTIKVRQVAGRPLCKSYKNRYK